MVYRRERYLCQKNIAGMVIVGGDLEVLGSFGKSRDSWSEAVRITTRPSAQNHRGDHAGAETGRSSGKTDFIFNLTSKL